MIFNHPIFGDGTAMGFGPGNVNVTQTITKTITTTQYFSKLENDVDPQIGKLIDEFAKSGKLKEGNLRTALEKLTAGGSLNTIEQAVVQAARRPALLIRDGDFVFPDSEDKEVQELYWKARLEARHDKLKAHIACVGRIGDANSSKSYTGTGWIVYNRKSATEGAERRLLVTNRHVASELFDAKPNSGWPMLPGKAPIVDFRKEHDRPDSPSTVAKVRAVSTLCERDTP